MTKSLKWFPTFSGLMVNACIICWKLRVLCLDYIAFNKNSVIVLNNPKIPTFPQYCSKACKRMYTQYSGHCMNQLKKIRGELIWSWNEFFGRT